MKKIEHGFEQLLWSSRFMILLPVVASLLAATALVLIGGYEIFMVFKQSLGVFNGSMEVRVFEARALGGIISAIDMFLIATVMLIFGIGLYELFISKIDFAEMDTRSSRILVVHSLDELKEKLAKVIIMVLLVTFFKHALSMSYESIQDLLLLAGGILFSAAALFLLGRSFSPRK